MASEDKTFKSTYPLCYTAVRRVPVWIDIWLLTFLNFFFSSVTSISFCWNGFYRGGGPIWPFSAIPHSPLLHERVDDWVGELKRNIDEQKRDLGIKAG